MNERTRRAFASRLVAIDLLPYTRERPTMPIPNAPKDRFLRALDFLIRVERKPSHSKAARAAGIPRGTVASWLHRDAAFCKRVSDLLETAEAEYRELDEDPPTPHEAEAYRRITELPEVELARIAVGDVPSRRFMETAFDEDLPHHPSWLQAFPG